MFTTEVSSLSVQSWVAWVKKMPEELKVVIRNCPESVMSQLLLVHDFAPANLTVESVMFPYFCSS
ncbi:MAG: hypothetical protein HRT45_18235 [Bdellovibrionales bacterium]|nr:hypothetical protein [Bdellovibrionales bacterium]